MCEVVETAGAEECFGSDRPTQQTQIIRLAVTFGTSHVSYHQAVWGRFDNFVADDPLIGATIVDHLWQMVRPVIASRIIYNGPITQVPDDMIEEANKIAEVLSIDIDAMFTEATKDNPEPKSWKNLKADGTEKPAKKKKTKKKAVKK